MLAGDKNHSRRPAPLPKHGQACAERSGAARLYSADAQVPGKRQPLFQLVYVVVKKERSSRQGETALLCRTEGRFTVVSPEGNTLCLVQRVKIAYILWLYAPSQCSSIGQKYCRKDFFGFSFACITFVNYQFDLSHNYLLRENNRWKERKIPSICFLTQRQKCKP